MKAMTSSTVERADLLDLKLLPSWLKEPAEAKNYEYYTAEEQSRAPRSGQRDRNRRRRASVQRSTQSRETLDGQKRRKLGRDRRARGARDREEGRRSRSGDVPVPRTPPLTIRFLPYSRAFENVITQINSGSVAYSLFALARLFLEKPGRYEVCLTAKAEAPVYQLGDGVVSVDREFLDRNAFRFGQRDFYRIDVVESDPIKGNFSNVARCRLSGTLLGPTNYHTYQPQLRSLYEQRFSRRMSFAEYQRQVEILSDPALVDRWKDEARKVTSYTTLREESPLTLSSVVETERHFRSNYLPGLIRSLEHVTKIGRASC